MLGLRRPLELAVARTLIMSLWKVPGEIMYLRVARFYHQLLNGGGRLRMALAEIWQKRPSPVDGGTFICQGGTGPLFPNNS